MTNPPKRARLSREESQAQTREHLLEAARRLFIQAGFGGVSLRDIAHEAGYSQGAFYSNFPSKESVLLELLRRHMEEEARQLSALLESVDQSTDDVLAGLEAWATELDQDADWAVLAVELQLHANRSPAFAAEYGTVWEVHRGELARFIARLFGRLGLIPPAEPTQLAASFMALAHGLALQRATTGQEPVGRMIMVFTRGLIASAKASSP
ncbi:TetR/AcrR family transcriptional regulator [Andreprevotia chitinilytica]|uniref:TetR/AcrR family transcriptional regulator n=1 Tax=Andreprevotia chitinilytica TaxID=396808 RepID=UPI000557B69E|nr:TetR/AcrR family transcriptional regulator [Andreprevotia chitinilytica]